MSHPLLHLITRTFRRYLVGSEQRWAFEQPQPGWVPQPIEQTSLYLHVPFCRHFCPYCPYTKVPFHESLIEPYTRAALAEVDRWADTVGSAEITSIYIGGGTPTLAVESAARVLERVRRRFRLTGDICIETNPADINGEIVQRLHDMGIGMVSLGIESFQANALKFLGRGYGPNVGEKALALLSRSGFASVNTDLMFALPGQSTASVLADLAHVVDLGADQVTAYPLFTFPYTSVGEYLHLSSVKMPDLRVRKEQYSAIHDWCEQHGFERTSVWGFKRQDVPRYSSVTRDGYIGVGPGAGSQLPDCFVPNTFDLNSWIESNDQGKLPIALRMPFAGEMAGWWWLYWRLYDTRIPLADVPQLLGTDTRKAQWWLTRIEKTGFAIREGDTLWLTQKGAFWLHLAQNYFALNYVNTLWTQARREPWPKEIWI